MSPRDITVSQSLRKFLYAEAEAYLTNKIVSLYIYNKYKYKFPQTVQCVNLILTHCLFRQEFPHFTKLFLFISEKIINLSDKYL